jgi:tRNA-Thr(GGU) m(6)t(6)A37 methyltransferase TsaA
VHISADRGLRKEGDVELKPIGIIHTPYSSREGMPRSTSQAAGTKGTVELFEEYRAGLKDLDSFSHVILIWHLDRSTGFRLEVVPPKQTQTRGLFASRSPNRPNPIGLSIVRLDRIADGVLHVDGVDMLDGTPLLDIKPYIPASDSIPEARAGWLDHVRKPEAD